METSLHDIYIYILIPSLVGVITAMFYAMFISDKKFSPHKVRDEEGRVVAYFIGWIGHAMGGVVSGLFIGSLLGTLEQELWLILIGVIIGTYFWMKYLEAKWPKEGE